MLLNAACNLNQLHFVEFEVTVKTLPNHYLTFMYLTNLLFDNAVYSFSPSFSVMIKVRFTARSSHSRLQKYTLYSGEATPLL
jgi:hypothetical protein